jgi:hypothetical protein
MVPSLNDDDVFESVLKVKKMIDDLWRGILEDEMEFIKTSMRFGFIPRSNHLLLLKLH